MFWLLFAYGISTFSFQDPFLLNNEDIPRNKTPYGEGFRVKYLNEVVLPLTAYNGRIVDSLGSRIKLVCVNWAAHMESMLPEGLAENGALNYSRFIKENGFNCVRFTFSCELIKNRLKTIGEVNEMNIKSGEPGITQSDLIELFRINGYNESTTLMTVLDDALQALRKYNIFVILDNHTSKASWCCPIFDGNRFWGNPWFDPDDWLQQLDTVVQLTEDFNWSNVIGIGLRNEVFTLRMDAEDLWFYYMRKGARVVHSRNPNLLIIVGGLRFASKLTQLKNNALFPRDETIFSKIVLEFHFYNRFYVRFFWPILRWERTCSLMTQFLQHYVGFIHDDRNPEYHHPLFVSEFGFDFDTFKWGHVDRDWLTCFELFIGKERDLDFGIWQLHGKYYFRLGQGYEAVDTFGVMNNENSEIRSREVMDSLLNLMKVHDGDNIDKVILRSPELFFQ